jgi:hypothetical protein
MADNERAERERFCWVKAVLQPPPCDAVQDPGVPWTLACADGSSMPPPPSPAKLVDARGIKLSGSGTPPPDQTMMPKIPASANAQSSQGGTDDFWRVASFAPGAEVPDSAPVMTLAFLPMVGSHAEVREWRRKHPEWFADAVAVSLLSYEW